MLTRTQVRELRDDLADALKTIELDGWVLTLGNCSFGTTATFKLEAAPVGEDGEAVSKEAEDYKRYAPRVGLPANGVGRTFKSRGHTFTVRGYLPKSFKFPVACERRDGKRFKFPVESVKRLLTAKK